MTVGHKQDCFAADKVAGILHIEEHYTGKVDAAVNGTVVMGAAGGSRNSFVAEAEADTDAEADADADADGFEGSAEAGGTSQIGDTVQIGGYMMIVDRFEAVDAVG